jgi:hypothetical protein
VNFVSSRLWTIDHRAFEEICGSGECASTDGFLLESGTADSFGMRYVEEGFDWIEARGIAGAYQETCFSSFVRSGDRDIQGEGTGLAIQN